MRGNCLFGLVVAAAWIAASPGFAQAPFQWRGQLSPGQTVEIRGINGDIRATAAPSAEVEVDASRSARRSDPNEVRIDVVPHAGGVVICAIYPTPAGSDPNVCEPGNFRSNNRNNDTVVHFDVRVPAGVALVARTVNGEISAESLRSDAEANTVNGSVRVTTTGRAAATTVNGSVTATMGRADWPRATNFKTVNGSITLTLPGLVNADLRAEMMTGSLTSDFPVTITSSTNSQETPRRLRGTIGSGGRELNLSTVNGSIRLLKAP